MTGVMFAFKFASHYLLSRPQWREINILFFPLAGLLVDALGGKWKEWHMGQ